MNAKVVVNTVGWMHVNEVGYSVEYMADCSDGTMSVMLEDSWGWAGDYDSSGGKLSFIVDEARKLWICFLPACLGSHNGSRHFF